MYINIYTCTHNMQTQTYVCNMFKIEFHFIFIYLYCSDNCTSDVLLPVCTVS